MGFNGDIYISITRSYFTLGNFSITGSYPLGVYNKFKVYETDETVKIQAFWDRFGYWPGDFKPIGFTSAV